MLFKNYRGMHNMYNMIPSPVADEKLKTLNFKPFIKSNKQSEIAKKNNWLDSTII